LIANLQKQKAGPYWSCFFIIIEVLKSNDTQREVRTETLQHIIRLLTDEAITAGAAGFGSHCFSPYLGIRYIPKPSLVLSLDVSILL
jgi:hypothetical protein